MSQPFSEFERPPIVGLVFGVQFAPLSRLSSRHLGWFGKQFRDDEWVKGADAVLVAGLAFWHTVAVRTFFRITSAAAHAHWGFKS